jgi:hypothetical protein
MLGFAIMVADSKHPYDGKQKPKKTDNEIRYEKHVVLVQNEETKGSKRGLSINDVTPLTTNIDESKVRLSKPPSRINDKSELAISEEDMHDDAPETDKQIGFF